MSTATTPTPAVLLSGFCGNGYAPAGLGTHTPCPIVLGSRERPAHCPCACHAPLVDVVTPTPLTLVRAELPRGTAETEVPVDPTSPSLDDVDGHLTHALHTLQASLTEVGEVLAAWTEQHDGDPVALALTTGRLRELRQELVRTEASVEARACRALRGHDGPVTLPDGRLAERLGGAKRTQWQHDQLAHRVGEHAVQTHAQVADPDTGELVLDEELAAAVHAGVLELLACARPSWRTTDLKKRSIRFDDLVTTEPGTASLRISARESTGGAA